MLKNNELSSNTNLTCSILLLQLNKTIFNKEGTYTLGANTKFNWFCSPLLYSNLDNERNVTYHSLNEENYCVHPARKISATFKSSTSTNISPKMFIILPAKTKQPSDRYLQVLGGNNLLLSLWLTDCTFFSEHTSPLSHLKGLVINLSAMWKQETKNLWKP